MDSINQNKDTQPAFPKGNPFEVPDSYFDRFPHRIAELIEEKEAAKIFTFSSLLKPIPILAFAAMFVFVSIIGLKVLNQNSSEVTDEEIADYFVQQGMIDEFEIDDIVNYSSNSTSTLASLDSITTKASVSTEEAAIIERLLLEDDIELNDLIDEL